MWYTADLCRASTVTFTSSCFVVVVVVVLGYWPSYNVPFHEEIYNKSGYPDVVAVQGPDFSYQLAPRAKIFRRDQGKVTDIEVMKMMMRYNGEFTPSFLS